jgi:hypothetical protein
MAKIDDASMDLWSKVVLSYTTATPKKLEPFDTQKLCICLAGGISKVAHDRYQQAWVKRRGKRKQSSTAGLLGNKHPKV